MTGEPLLPPDKYLTMGGDLTNCLWDSAGDLLFYEDMPITDALKARLKAWETGQVIMKTFCLGKSVRLSIWRALLLPALISPAP